jgi:hypothetical protein
LTVTSFPPRLTGRGWEQAARRKLNLRHLSIAACANPKYFSRKLKFFHFRSENVNISKNNLTAQFNSSEIKRKG